MFHQGSTNIVNVLLIGGHANQQLGLREGVKKEVAMKFHLTRKRTLPEGLNALRDGSFQAVLLDLSLPDASIAESVIRIRQLSEDLPIIALTNDREMHKVAEALSLGAQDYALSACRCSSVARVLEYVIERKALISKIDDSSLRMTKDREQLVSHLSHELRNALACIHQFGNILIDGLAGEMSGEQREYVGIMLQNSSRIRDVIDRLLEAENGPCDVPDLANGATYSGTAK